MIPAGIKKTISTIALSSLIAGQVLTTGSILLLPKTAEAQVAGLATVPTADLPTIYERIAIGVARGILAKFTETFLNRFTQKLTDKYKIRNFLYYDKVLTDYYLNRYIADKITDPELRSVYTLLERGFVSGQSTGTTGGPDPRRALIPRLNQAITNYYISQGGIDPAKVRNPNNFPNDKEYFNSLMAFYSNHPSFTEQNLQGEFGSFQSSAATSSQLEILVGNGLKAGRIIGGTCNLSGVTVQTGVDPNASPQGCEQAGGTWQASLVDNARSFIDNPSQYVQNHLDAAISQHFDNLYDPSTDFWTQVGKSFGGFIWNQLGLNKSTGTLPDSPIGYAGEDFGNPNTPPGTPTTLGEGEIDIDGDGIVDGTDYTGDGIIDICSYGGTPPDGCVGSKSIITGNPAEGPCQITSMQLPELPNARADGNAAITQALQNLPTEAGFTGPTSEDDPALRAAAEAIIKEAASILNGQGYDVAGLVLNCNGNVSKDLIIIGRTADSPFAAVYDVFNGIEGPGTLASKFNGLDYVHHTDAGNVR